MRYEVIYGHAAVWVNDVSACLGRFGQRGIDVHDTIAAQLDGAPQCLFCTHTDVTSDDWPRFVAAMRKYHGIDLSDQPVPAWLQQRET